MDLVHRNRGGGPVAVRALVHPFRVFPKMAVEARNDRTRLGPQFGVETVGIALEHWYIRDQRANLVLVDGAFDQSGHEKFPDARWATISHGVCAAVPLIEVSNHAYAHGVRRPHGELHTSYP